MNNNPPTLGGRIRQERERLGLCEPELAERIGVHRLRLRALEEDATKRGPKPVELTLLGVVGFDVNYILTGMRVLSAEEQALVENYRASSTEQKTSLKAVGDAFAQSQIGDGAKAKGGGEPLNPDAQKK